MAFNKLLGVGSCKVHDPTPINQAIKLPHFVVGAQSLPGQNDSMSDSLLARW